MVVRVVDDSWLILGQAISNSPDQSGLLESFGEVYCCRFYGRFARCRPPSLCLSLALSDVLTVGL